MEDHILAVTCYWILQLIMSFGCRRLFLDNGVLAQTCDNQLPKVVSVLPDEPMPRIIIIKLSDEQNK